MNRGRKRDFVIKEMNLLRLPHNADNFLSSWETASFSVGTCRLELVINVFMLYTKTFFRITNIWNRTLRFCTGLHYQQRQQNEVRFGDYSLSEWPAIPAVFSKHAIQRCCQLRRCRDSLINDWMKIEHWKNDLTREN